MIVGSATCSPAPSTRKSALRDATSEGQNFCGIAVCKLDLSRRICHLGADMLSTEGSRGAAVVFSLLGPEQWTVCHHQDVQRPSVTGGAPSGQVKAR